ncbi:aminopeptidase N [Legionella dresdenensis]|uniref:Aminopeptidase N n=1 Tax=Legionella dresdenensis TaxID=450200 RepID=A0ABV8CHN9_9GAMM
MTDKTIYLKDYQPLAFEIAQVELDFELYDDHALVKNRMKINRIRPGALQLNGDELELVSIELDDTPLSASEYRLVDADLWLDNCPEHFTLTITTRIKPQDNTKLSGLYRSNQLFCTQCEAEGFRRITFYPDRPDVLSIFTTRISADKAKYPILLSNGNLIDSGDAGNGRHWVIWQDPFKKPSYLFALVAGNLACVKDQFVTNSGKEVDLRIYVEPGNEDKCGHAMESLKNSMRWDEQVYGREYDLSIFMIVAVSDFNMGAMENKGLNIFNSKYILGRPDTATDQDFADIEGVVGHEYFHNWTGNRVTCRDWFQLSLKEGLTVFRDQEFSRDMNSRDVNRIADVKALKATQFPEDAGSMAHPVRPESYQEINNFYTATIYNKGAEVIRMQHTLLGAAGFRKGMDLYFERHDGQAVTIDDFVAAMEDANQVDFSQLKRWYSQAGTPEVEVSSDYANNCLTLTMKQSCPPTPECKQKQPFLIPIRIALFDPNGTQIALQNEVLELKEPEQRFVFNNLPCKPIISLLRDFSAPIKLVRDVEQEELIALMRYETNGYAKWDAAQRLTLASLTGLLAIPRSDWSISSALIEAYRHILMDKTLDQSLKADLLTPPGFEEIANNLSEIDVDLVEAARDFYRQELGKALFEQAQALYQQLWQAEDHQMNGTAYGRRKLRNTCLWLMMKANEQQALPICEQQYQQARTMTDQIAGLSLLNNIKDQAKRQQALDSFYQQWAQDDLVLDKWFAIQATTELPTALNQVRELMQHPAFSLKNPNKVRSLIGAFCQANARNFHALDGSGYQFLTELLITMDKINPQIAARLATPFTRWQRYDHNRQQLMKNELQRLASQKLSRDLNEIVSKSLN